MSLTKEQNTSKESRERVRSCGWESWKIEKLESVKICEGNKATFFFFLVFRVKHCLRASDDIHVSDGASTNYEFFFVIIKILHSQTFFTSSHRVTVRVFIFILFSSHFSAQTGKRMKTLLEFQLYFKLNKIFKAHVCWHYSHFGVYVVFQEMSIIITKTERTKRQKKKWSWDSSDEVEFLFSFQLPKRFLRFNVYVFHMFATFSLSQCRHQTSSMLSTHWSFKICQHRQ